jgi:hypothetical protein
MSGIYANSALSETLCTKIVLRKTQIMWRHFCGDRGSSLHNRNFAKENFRLSAVQLTNWRSTLSRRVIKLWDFANKSFIYKTIRKILDVFCLVLFWVKFRRSQTAVTTPISQNSVFRLFLFKNSFLWQFLCIWVCKMGKDASRYARKVCPCKVPTLSTLTNPSMLQTGCVTMTIGH